MQEHLELENLTDLELAKYLDFVDDKNISMIIIIINIFMKRIKVKCDLLESENIKLRNHIMSMPDGYFYFEAKKHYDNSNLKNS
jgi:ascorbate-specific PTS system EIIC-type component UlaA